MTRGAKLATAWFALGVALTTASQLRIPGLPLGPGEMVLASWVAPAAALALWRGKVSASPMGLVVVLFWLLAFTTLLLGGLVGVDRQQPQHFYHDLLAFTFVASTLAVFVTQPGLEERIRFAIPLVALASTLPVLLLLLAGFPVWEGPRLQGWAVNANQLALAFAPIPFAAFHQFGESGWRVRLAHTVALLCALVMGVFTLSDALLVAWLIALVTGAALVWLRTAASPGTLLPKAAAYFLVPALAVLAVALRGREVYDKVAGGVSDVYTYGGQGSVRITLWRNGLEAMASSPLVGNGPGPQSGLFGPFTGSEAHNTLIDWGASTGLVGLALYVGIMFWTARRAWRAGNLSMLLLLVAIFAFSLFHYVLRQPIFWFYLTAVGALSRAPADGARRLAPAVAQE